MHQESDTVLVAAPLDAPGLSPGACVGKTLCEIRPRGRHAFAAIAFDGSGEEPDIAPGEIVNGGTGVA